MQTFVKRIGGAAAIGVAMLVGGGLSAPLAQAAYIVTLEQVGTNVVATGIGSLNPTAFTISDTNITAQAAADPSTGYIIVGPPALTSAIIYQVPTSFTGPSNFGPGSGTDPTTGSGPIVGLSNPAIRPTLTVPADYVSGSPLGTSTDTWENASFSSLGVTPGVYEWTWGSGADADSFTLDIGVAAAPVIGQGLPVVLAIGVVLLGAKLRERSKSRRSFGTAIPRGV